MAAIAYAVTRIAGTAESIGYRAWFDFATCYIHKMRGTEVARFEMDDGRNFRVGAEFVADMNSVYGEEFLDLVAVLSNAGGSQSRDGLYALQDQALDWWSIKELPDGTGSTTIARSSRDAMYTKRDVERLRRRYDITSHCVAVEIKPETPNGGEGDESENTGQNNTDSNGNNNFFRQNF